VPPERAEPDLRRAIAILDRLIERAPEKKRITYAAALARWNGWLAKHLDRLGRVNEAVAVYRASIAHDEWLADQISDPSIVHDVLASRRAALADILIRLDRKDDARPLVDRAASDIVRNVGEDDCVLRGAADAVVGCLESLARSFRSLGEEERAAELEELSQRVRARARDGRPGHRGGGRGRLMMRPSTSEPASEGRLAPVRPGDGVGD